MPDRVPPLEPVRTRGLAAEIERASYFSENNAAFVSVARSWIMDVRDELPEALVAHGVEAVTHLVERCVGDTADLAAVAVEIL